MNEKFPALSQKVAVEYEENRGRFVVAAGDIQPGDTICTEKPYASVLLYEEYGTHCQHCFILWVFLKLIYGLSLLLVLFFDRMYLFHLK